MFKTRVTTNRYSIWSGLNGSGWLIGAILVALIGLYAHRLAMAEKTSKDDIVLMVTGSNNGDFEPCGCGGVYEGGLSRRSTLLSELKKEQSHCVLVDTGDITGGGYEVQWEFLSQAYHQLGYDAIALGEGELRLGLDVLDRYVRKYDLPIVASNIKFTIPMAVREVVTVERGGRTLAFISVVADRWLGILPAPVREAIQYEKPADAVRRMTAKLKGKYDAIILLSHVAQMERHKLAGALDGVDLWIDTGGHQWGGRHRPAATSQPAFLIADQTPPLLVSWRNDRKIGVARLTWPSSTLRVSDPRVIAVARDVAEDNRYLEIYDAYKFVSRQEMLNRLFKKRKATTQPANRLGFVSPETCGGCHQKIYNFWKSTGHARAFATLKKGGRDADVNCLGCHTTGYREPGGFDTPMSTPSLRNVGCQSCHRVDLAKHHRMPLTTRQAVQAKRQTRKQMLTKSWQCQRCHVSHRSPKFDYRSYLKKIKCLQVNLEDKGRKSDYK